MRNIFEYLNLSANVATIMAYLESKDIKKKHIIFVVLIIILLCVGLYYGISEEDIKGKTEIGNTINTCDWESVTNVNSDNLNLTGVGENQINFYGEVDNSAIGNEDNEIINNLGDENINIDGGGDVSNVYIIKGNITEVSNNRRLELSQECADSEYLYKNYETAFRITEELSKQGNASAMCNLGYFYENGYGCDQDLSMAKKWYDKAIQNGSSSALFNKFSLYLKDIRKSCSFYDLQNILVLAYEQNNEGILDYIRKISDEQENDIDLLVHMDSEELERYFSEYEILYNSYSVKSIIQPYQNNRYYEYLFSSKDGTYNYYRVYERKRIREGLLQTSYTYSEE